MKISSLCINSFLFWIVLHFSDLKIKLETALRGASIISRGCLFFLTVTSLFYVLSPSYFNYVETNMAALGIYWLAGHDLYTSLGSAERYSMLYGPWPYIAGSLASVFNIFVIPATKLMGWLHFLVSVISFSLLLQTTKLARSQKQIAFGFFSFIMLGFDNFSYVNRADSFLIAYALLSLYFVQKYFNLKPLVVSLLVGLCFGFSVASKVHGFAYFIPIVAFAFEQKKPKNPSLCFFFFALSGVVSSFFPFFLPHISFQNYAIWLTSTAHHGFSLKLFTDNISYFAVYIIVLVGLKFHKHWPLTFRALLLSGLVVSVFGSLIGAGTHHLLPLLPLSIFFGALQISEDTSILNRKTAVILSAFLLGLCYDAFISQKAVVTFLDLASPQRAQSRELEQITSHDPTLHYEMGYSDNAEKELSYFSPLLVARGGPLLIEFTGLMDIDFARIPMPESTFEALQACAVKAFVIPRGSTPWTVRSGYTGEELFSPRWKSLFEEHFTKRESHRFYDLYLCR